MRVVGSSTFGRWRVRNKLWPTNPVEQLEPIRRPKHLPRPFPDDEARRIMALTLPADQAMLRAQLALTGLRVTPACNLKVGDISFSPSEIRAWVKEAKTQVVQMHPALDPLRRDYITQHTDGRPNTILFRNRASARARGHQIDGDPYRGHERAAGFRGGAPAVGGGGLCDI